MRGEREIAGTVGEHPGAPSRPDPPRPGRQVRMTRNASGRWGAVGEAASLKADRQARMTRNASGGAGSSASASASAIRWWWGDKWQTGSVASASPVIR